MCCENMSTYSVWIVIMFFTLLFIYFNDLDVISSIVLMYLVLWHCWLGDMKGIRPVKQSRTNNHVSLIFAKHVDDVGDPA